MAPKKHESGADGLTPEQLRAQADNARLLQRALDNGVVGERAVHTANQLPVCRALLKADGKDIVKKSSNRKNRYLMVFNCLLAPASAGKLGTLAQLDSKNPVLYMEFPAGRLKFFGKLMFPKNKYMVLRPGANSVLCEDVFENLVVFSDAWWVGKTEDNPNEHKLDMPADMINDKPHEAYDYAYGAGAKDGELANMKGASKSTAAAELGTTDEAVAASPLRPRRAAAAKCKYDEDTDNSQDDGGDDDDDEHVDEDEDDQRNQTAAPSHRRLANGAGNDSADAGCSHWAVDGVTRQPTLPQANADMDGHNPGTLQTSRPAKRIRRTTASDTEPDDDPDIPQAGTAGAAARRTPRQAAAKRKYADLSESEQEEEEEDSGMEEDDDISSLEIATGSHAKRAKQKQPVHTTSKAAAKGKANQKQGSHSAKHKTSKPALADSDMQNTDEVVLISDNSDTPPSTKPNSRKQVAKASIPQVNLLSDSEDTPAAVRAKAAARQPASSRKVGASPAGKAAAARGSTKRHALILGEDDDDELNMQQLTGRRTPSRQAAVASRKRLKDWSDDESEEEQDDDNGGDDDDYQA
eukprot:jgi/Chrzof1/13760/Cz08g11060.t1